MQPITSHVGAHNVKVVCENTHIKYVHIVMCLLVLMASNVDVADWSFGGHLMTSQSKNLEFSIGSRHHLSPQNVAWHFSCQSKTIIFFNFHSLGGTNGAIDFYCEMWRRPNHHQAERNAVHLFAFLNSCNHPLPRENQQTVRNVSPAATN